LASSNPLLLLLPCNAVTPEQERWAEQLLAAAKTKRDLPALAGEAGLSALSAKLYWWSFARAH
jgi:hypothetical protein